jgi:hypothetical protein
VVTKRSLAEAWTTIETMFTLKTRARTVNTRLALATTHKVSMTVTEYVAKMRSLGEEMATAGRTLEDEDLVEYILTGLDEEYNSVVSSVLSRPNTIFVSELYSQLLAFETRIDLHNKGGNNLSASSSKVVNRDRGCGGSGHDSNKRGGCTRRGNSTVPCGGRNSYNNTPHQECHNSNNSSSECPMCQVCCKIGHTAEGC